MLIFATLGMFLYAIYSIGWAVNDLFHGARLEMWAEFGLMGFGALLAFGAVLLRAQIPGALAFAIAALLGLQAIDVHNAAHLQTGVAPQIARAAFALLVSGMAFVGGLPRRTLRREVSQAASGQRPPAAG